MKNIEHAVQNVERNLTSYAQTHHFQGLLQITLQDEVLLQHCIGIENPETGVPITSQTHFTFYSLSKPFCALGFMKLVDRGLVCLDDHPGRYIPEAADFDLRMTIRHMLHHTSGMADFINHSRYTQICSSTNSQDIPAIVRELSHYPMRFEPGTDTQYANINFTLAALIIEAITGQSYSDYMQSQVFDPLGMQHAAIDHADLILPHRAIGMDLQEGRLVPVGRTVGWLLGAGDIIGTAADLYCLNHAIKHRLLLSDACWQEILTPAPNNNFGLGCSLSLWHNRRRITHNGGHIGFRNLHIQLPDEDFDIILLSNCGFGTAREDLSEMIYDAFFGTDCAYSGCLNMDGAYIPHS